MTHPIKTLAVLTIAAFALSGCAAAKLTGKAAALPFKAAGKTTALAGKGVYHTGRLTGKGVYETGKFAGNSVYQTGRGVYYMGRIPVQITDQALDTSTKVLTVTTQVVTLTGQVATVSRQIHAAELDNELANINRSANVVRVFVDAFS